MNFLNPFLLFGVVAFAIPLIIHLLNKRRFRELQWGAVHLLHDVVKKNHRRLRLEQLFLLLLRIGIPILLALLMAKPVLTRSIRWLEDQRVSTLFLIDDSYSMQAGDADDSPFARAKESIKKITESLTDGSDTAALLIGGSRPRGLTDDPTTETEAFVEHLDKVSAEGDPVGVAEALQASLAELDSMDNVAREVIVVSDFQTIDWMKPSVAMNRQAAMDALSESKSPVSVTLLRVGQPSAATVRENVAVVSVETSTPVVGVHQKVTLRATLQNFGKQSYPDLAVQCKIDGRPHRASRVTVGPEQQVQALFTHTFDTAGSHIVEVSLEPDGLAADNQFVTAISVLDQLPTLLLVNRENINAAPLQGDADFIELALQPYGSSTSNPSDLKDLIVTQKLSEERVHDRLLDESRVVVMTNVKQLRGSRDRIREFVKNGGGLLIFLGGDTDVDWFNRELFRNGDGMLPLPIQRVEGEGITGSTLTSANIQSEVFEHPAFSFFNDPRNGNLSRARWTRWFTLGLNDDAPDDLRKKVAESVSIIARLNHGDPWLVEKKFGEGRVILAAAPADADWGNLPTHPFFVPMMQRLVSNLAASVEPQRNLSPGDKIVGFLSRNQAGRTVRMVDPDGVEHELKVKGDRRRARVEFSQTRTPGVYQLSDAAGKIDHYVVNLARTESDLTLLTQQQITTLGEEMDASVANGWQEYASLDRERRTGTGIWRPILWILLAILFLEVLFQQWMTRRPLQT